MIAHPVETTTEELITGDQPLEMGIAARCELVEARGMIELSPVLIDTALRLCYS